MNVAELQATLALKTDRGSFAAGDRLMGGIKKAVGALAAVASVRWFAGVIGGVVETADRIDELSQQVGVGVESLQALGYAAGFSGLSVDDLGGALGKMARNAAAAARGGKEQSRAFKDVGVDAKALANGTLSMEDALGQMAARFAKMPAGARKTAAAMAVLGRSGARLIPFLNEGTAGIKRMTDEARRLGLVLDEETNKSLVRLADQGTSLGGVWQGIKNDVVIALLPALLDLSDWFAKNRLRIRAFVRTAVDVLGRAFGIIGSILSRVNDALDWLADKLGVSKESVMGVIAAVALLGPLLGGLVPLAISAGLGIAAALGPIGLAAIAVGALIAGIGYVMSEMTFDEFKAKVVELMTWAQSQIIEIGKWIADKTKSIADTANDWVREKTGVDVLGDAGRAYSGDLFWSDAGGGIKLRNDDEKRSMVAYFAKRQAARREYERAKKKQAPTGQMPSFEDYYARRQAPSAPGAPAPSVSQRWVDRYHASRGAEATRESRVRGVLTALQTFNITIHEATDAMRTEKMIQDAIEDGLRQTKDLATEDLSGLQ